MGAPVVWTSWLISALPAPALVLDVIGKGTVVLLLALGMCSAWRRSSATVRHWVFAAAISANLLLPAVVTTVPALDIPKPIPLKHQFKIELKTASFTVEAAGKGAAGHHAKRGNIVERSQNGRPSHWLGWVWLAGAALVALRFAAGLFIVRRVLERSCPVTNPGILADAQNCRRRLGLKRDIPLLISPRAAVAFTWGWFRPRIVLPAGANNWPREKRCIVLLHELAHVKRWDALSTGLSQMAVILYWFNPLLWMARKRLLVDRERASDDVVLSTGIQASAYAACLLDIARTLRGKRWLPELQIAIARRFQLEERIAAILKGGGRRGSSGRGRSVTRGAVAVLLLTLMIPLAGWRIFAQSDVNATTQNLVLQTPSNNVTPAELREVDLLLDRFYGALGSGDDYESITERFLTADYFADPSRTFEHWPKERRNRFMLNTVKRVCKMWCGEELHNGVEIRGLREWVDALMDPDNPFGIEYSADVISCRKIGGEYHLEQRVDINARGAADCPQTLVKGLVHTIVFAREDGALKIRSYDGGIGVQRMDVDNPYGPIFVVTVDAEVEHAPSGPLLFKSIPRSVVKDAANTIPLRPGDPDS